MRLLNNLIKSTKLQVSIIALLVLLVYSNIFQNQLVVDDLAFVQNWPEIQSLEKLPELMTGSLPDSVSGTYRPIRSLLYALYFQIGGESAFIYHLHALLIHLLSTTLVYMICLKLFSSNAAMKQFSNLLAFSTALLFGLHPIHSESITYISAGMDTTAAALTLGSFYCYICSLGRRKWVVFSGLLFLLAIFTNELAIVLPLLIIWYDYCFKKSFKFSKTYFLYPALAAIYLFVRFFLINLSLSRGDYIAKSFYHTMILMPQIFLKYIWLLIYPVKLSFVHTLAPGFETYMTVYSNFDSILTKHFYDLDIILPIIILILGVFLILKYRKKYSLLCFSGGWFLICLLPVSYIIPVGPALSERYLYLPSVGFILLLVALLHCFIVSLLKKTISKACKVINNLTIQQFNNFLALFLISLSLVYGVLTYQRNKDWYNSESLWKSVIKVYPQSLIGNYHLSLALAQENEIDESINQYQNLLKFKPEFYEARFNLANLLLSKNLLDQAVSEYKEVIKTNPEFVPAYQKLGVVLIEKGKPDEAKKVLLSGVKFGGTNYKVLGNYRESAPVLADIKCQLNGLDALEFNQIKGIIFDILDNWKFDGLKLVNPENNISASLELRQLNQRRESFIASAIEPGNLEKEGLASIPNFESGYVKIWNYQGVSKYQFLLFSGQKVINIVIEPYPENQLLRQDLDLILGSLIICPNND